MAVKLFLSNLSNFTNHKKITVSDYILMCFSPVSIHSQMNWLFLSIYK